MRSIWMNWCACKGTCTIKSLLLPAAPKSKSARPYPNVAHQRAHVSLPAPRVLLWLPFWCAEEQSTRITTVLLAS